MTARGPDGNGLWISPDRSVGLAHRRLSLVDLSDAGSQPMATLDGSVRIVFNGEIYNYIDLRHRLEVHGTHFRSQSDTEVLLHLYAEMGPEMVNLLRGMYAFVIWDERKQRLFAARDPLGIKPLYYSNDTETLKIASQVKALIKGGAIDPIRDPAGQAGFLLLGYVPEPFTTYRAIRSLPAGAYMIASRGSQPEIHQFCQIEDELAMAASGDGKLPTSIDMREYLRNVISESVRRHLIADVPVGIFLSAGTDSSVVAALASESPHSRLRTITLGVKEYRGSQNDETGLAATVAENYAICHETRWISRSELAPYREKIIEAMDQPSIDGVNTYFVAKVAHEVGLKAALSGIGGDELFSGYPSFHQVPRIAKSFAGLVPGVVSRTIRVASAPMLRCFTSAKYAGLLEYAGCYGGAYLLRRALFMPWELPKLLDPDVAREGLNALQVETRFEETVGGIISPRLKVSALELKWYMRNQLLRDSDWAGMAHSLEIRTPLADMDVLRAVTRVNAGGMLHDGKHDLARLPAKPLPPALLERKKTGFKVPVDQYLTGSTHHSGDHDLRAWARRLAQEFGFECGANRRATEPTLPFETD